MLTTNFLSPVEIPNKLPDEEIGKQETPFTQSEYKQDLKMRNKEMKKIYPERFGKKLHFVLYSNHRLKRIHLVNW